MDSPKIIYQDQDIVVIDKPAGYVVNRADTVKEIETLQDWVESNIKDQKSVIEKSGDEEFNSRSGIVHRLDKETSGLILAAKNSNAFQNLKNQFKESRVEKTYVALVHGKMTPNEGEINVPIGRLPWNRMRFGVLPGGRESQTFYKVTDYKKLIIDKKEEDLTLVELYPKTGRTHQIRVHLKHLGYPIYADFLYGGRKNIKKDRKLLRRHFLHARKIKFLHPKTNEVMEFEADFSPELVDFLSRLK